MLLELLGRRIKKYRIIKGLSQEKFALSIGMDNANFASVETGKRNISIKNLKKISDGLDISLAELLKGM